MARVAFERVGKTYPNGYRALDEFSLAVADGELVVFVGPSGCGKSTLLRLLAGLEPVSSGHLRLDDEIVDDWPPQARNVAMVFQDYALYPTMTVRGNLSFPLKMRKLPQSEIKRRINWAADLLALGDVLDRLPKQLSGGQRQRVAMGRALVREPTVFLLDEPLSNLDAQLRNQVRGEIVDLQRRTGTTMIYVTHDQVEAMTMGHRIAVLAAGRLQQIGSPQTLYDTPANTFVAGFIGTPPMNLIPAGSLRAALAETAASPISPNAQQLSALLAADGCHTIGIRPEHLRLTATSQELAVRVRVVQCEYLGHETLAHFVLDSCELPPGPSTYVARVNGTTDAPTGDPCWAGFDFRYLHFFDCDQQARE